MIAVLLTLLATTMPGQPLPALIVKIDGVTASLGDINGDANAFYFDFNKAVDTLSASHAKVVGHPGYVTVDVDGTPRVKIPLGSARPIASTLDSAGKPIRQIELSGLPDLNGAGDYWIDAASFGRIMGDNVELEGTTLNLFTPEYWATQMGIPASSFAGLNARSIGAGLAFGATPPGRDSVIWLRPASKGRAQIYSVANAASTADIGQTATGERINFPTFDEVSNPQVDSDNPLRLLSEYHQGITSGQTRGIYACIYSPTMSASDDALELATQGTLKDWYVAGCRQLKSESSYAFQFVKVKGKADLDRVADEYQLPVQFLYEINGFGSSPNFKAGDKILVLSKDKDLAKGAQIPAGNLYETREGDSLDSLAKTWNTSVENILALNADLLPGQDLDPGLLLTAPAAAPVPAANIQSKNLFGKIKDPSVLQQSSISMRGTSPLEPGEPVFVQCQVPGNYYQLTVLRTAQQGYVQLSHVILDSAAQPAAPAFTGLTSSEQLVKNEALAHLGTKYVWGGHDLVNGIDCSHYVAAVLSRSVMTPRTVPQPPVVVQEQKGQLVHWKATLARRGGVAYWQPADARRGYQPFTLPTGPVPSVDNLRPGDRIILQWDPLNDRSGGRHTGIYVGAYGKYIKHGVANATCSRGVAVTDLFTRYFWKGYRYALRDPWH